MRARCAGISRDVLAITSDRMARCSAPSMPRCCAPTAGVWWAASGIDRACAPRRFGSYVMAGEWLTLTPLSTGRILPISRWCRPGTPSASPDVEHARRQRPQDPVAASSQHLLGPNVLLVFDLRSNIRSAHTSMAPGESVAIVPGASALGDRCRQTARISATTSSVPATSPARWRARHSGQQVGVLRALMLGRSGHGFTSNAR